jgi:hypothetical protein
MASLVCGGLVFSHFPDSASHALLPIDAEASPQALRKTSGIAERVAQERAGIAAPLEGGAQRQRRIGLGALLLPRADC